MNRHSLVKKYQSFVEKFHLSGLTFYFEPPCRPIPDVYRRLQTIVCFGSMIEDKRTSLYKVFQKNAQNFAHDKFWTVCRKMKFFSPKYSIEITLQSLYHPAQNLCKWVKHSLLNSWKWLYTSAGRCAVAQINTPVSHPVDKCTDFIEPSN